MQLQEELPSQTLFSLLEDKNQIINTLKKQLENQKSQIKFYMNKCLHTSNIVEFSKSCSPENVEDNIPLVLAMGSFRRDLGIKSKIYQMYERMNDLYRSSKETLQNQEVALKNFFTHLYLTFTSSSDTVDVRNIIGILKDPRQIVLINDLLDSTIDLKSILEHFRVSCERLIIIEDERNEIINQTLTLTPNENLNFKVLVNTKLENVQLRKELQKFKERNQYAATTNDFVPIGEKLAELQHQIESVFSSTETYNICNMLNSLNEEAKCLLTSTRKNINPSKDIKSTSENASKNFYKNKTSDIERHTVTVEYAQKEVKETKSIFHAEFYNTNESENDMKFFSSGQKNIFRENEYTRNVISQKVNGDVETFITNSKEHRELLQRIKMKDKHIYNLNNLCKHLNDKINFMQIIIDRQSEELSQQKMIMRQLAKVVAEENSRSHDEYIKIYQNESQKSSNMHVTSYQETQKQNVLDESLNTRSESRLPRRSQELCSENFKRNPNNENNSYKFAPSPTSRSFLRKRNKLDLFRSPVKSVGLFVPNKTYSVRNCEIKKQVLFEHFSENRLFIDASVENMPTICLPVRKNGNITRKVSKNRRNLTEKVKNIWGKNEYFVEEKVETNYVSNETYCIPFEKI